MVFAGIEFKNEFVIVGQLDSETDILGIAQLFYGIIQIVSGKLCIYRQPSNRRIC